MRAMITGNQAAAWGARLAAIDYLPAFPITPQTEIIETIAQWVENGEFACRMVTLESEHSMITAAGAAAATGVRVFSATSSQGLLYAMEMLYTVAGWRAPFVLANVSRGLASPITLEPDHNDVLAARDCGFLQLHCATCQEVLDAVLIAYRLAEDAQVRLPVIVNLDGFYLSFTREPVQIPAIHQVSKFLPPFDSLGLKFRAGKPLSDAMAVLGGTPYSYFRYQNHLAAMRAVNAFTSSAKAFGDAFGRHYQTIEAYRCDDADVVFLMIGSFATKAKAAVDRLREAGQSVGLVRPFLLRPFPVDDLRKILDGKRGVAVVDQNLSPGTGGILHKELAAHLYDVPDPRPVLVSFVGGLGGRDISNDEFYAMADVTREASEQGRPPPPRLLFTRQDWREMRKLQAIAHARQSGGAAP
ncbi:MAG: pyruvate synthase [Deltaproteobacteria bacterium]|jgi:pyruvate ferredoxin oxidoreductase alpha subunit|nr:pyruvate synthase [Deltaproteobacteria bacterium]